MQCQFHSMYYGVKSHIFKQKQKLLKKYHPLFELLYQTLLDLSSGSSFPPLLRERDSFAGETCKY